MKIKQPGLTAIVIFLSFFVTESCLATARGFVNTPGGLSLRKQPKASAKLIMRMPSNAELEIIDADGPVETIEKKKSPWFKVRYKNMTGWAFGGFISTHAHADKSSDTAEQPRQKVPLEVLADEEPAERDFVRNEKATIKKWGRKITRKGKSLKLKCSKNKTVELVDDDSDGESHVSYYCIDYFSKEGLYMIYGQLYEGSEHFFVSEKTGKTIVLGDMPIFSRNRSRIAVAGLDIMAAYDFNGIRIFKIQGDELEKEFEIMPSEWGPQNLKWLDEEKITFDKFNGYGEKISTASLNYDSNSKTWNIRE